MFDVPHPAVHDDCRCQPCQSGRRPVRVVPKNVEVRVGDTRLQKRHSRLVIGPGTKLAMVETPDMNGYRVGSQNAGHVLPTAVGDWVA